MGSRKRYALFFSRMLTLAKHEIVFAGLLFVEVSSLTGKNISTPFLLAGRTILSAIDAGTLDPDSAGSGVSYGERQLRAVGSQSRLSAAFGSSVKRKRRRDSVSIRDMVGGQRCSC